MAPTNKSVYGLPLPTQVSTAWCLKTLAPVPSCSALTVQKLSPEERAAKLAADAFLFNFSERRVLQNEKMAHRAMAAPRSSSSGRAPKTAFGMMVRTADDFLWANVQKLNASVFPCCEDWRLFYVENDSTDSTNKILRILERTDHRISGVHLKLHNNHTVEMCHNQTSPNCGTRIRFLSMLRERVLRLALGWQEAELYVMLDADFHAESFQPELFWQMFTRVIEACGADGVFPMSRYANGFSTFRCSQMPFGCRLYDYGSVLPSTMLSRSMLLADEIVPVSSGHSGFAMYSVASIRRHGASYEEVPTDEFFKAIGDDAATRRKWGIIETMWFNMRLPRLFVLTKFRPAYGARPGVGTRMPIREKMNLSAHGIEWNLALQPRTKLKVAKWVLHQQAIAATRDAGGKKKKEVEE